MPRRKKPVYHSDLPDHVIESIARLIYPDIVAYYESEEGQKEFAEWKPSVRELQNYGKVLA